MTRSHRRPGVVVLELILCLPILVIVLLAVIEFGAIMANVQAVAFAARDGARLAARSAPLNAGTAAAVRAIVDDRLEAAGLGAAASEGVALQHTVNALPTLIDGSCTTPTSALPAGSVRVRVCVRADKLAPNLLQTLGFSIAGFTIEQQAAFDYEP